MNTDRDDKNQPKLGQIVKVLRGRDDGKFAVVIGIEERFAFVADGDKRKFDKPKKKNLLHLELQDDIASEVVDSLLETGRVTNGKLRFAISRFIERKNAAQEKGE